MTQCMFSLTIFFDLSPATFYSITHFSKKVAEEKSKKFKINLKVHCVFQLHTIKLRVK